MAEYIPGGRDSQHVTAAMAAARRRRRRPPPAPLQLLQLLATTGAELGTESCSGSQATQGAMGRDRNVCGRGLI